MNHVTRTCDGAIPHLNITIAGIELCAPVRLVTFVDGLKGRTVLMNQSVRLPYPERHSDGRLVFALPGGGGLLDPRK